MCLVETTGVLPKGPLHDFRQGLIELAYRGVYTVLGSYIAASLAPNRPMKHALALGVVGFVANILGAVATWMQVAKSKMMLIVSLNSLDPRFTTYLLSSEEGSHRAAGVCSRSLACGGVKSSQAMQAPSVG